MHPHRALMVGVLASLCLGTIVSHQSAWSQAARTIKIVISVPPGGTIDFLVRILADQIGKTNGRAMSGSW